MTRVPQSPPSAAGLPGHNWNDPDRTLLNRGLLPAPRLDLALFGLWAPWIRKTADASSAPPDYVAAGLVTCACSLIGNSRVVLPEPTNVSWRERFALWTALVGPPSSGKTPALRPLIKAVDHIEEEEGIRAAPAIRAAAEKRAVAEQEAMAWRKKTLRTLSGNKGRGTIQPVPVIPELERAPRVIVRSATLEALAQILSENPRGLYQRP